MRRSIKTRPLANVIIIYFLFWLLYNVWETQASPEMAFTFFAIGLGVFFLVVLPDAFQWSLLAGHAKVWSLLGVLRNEDSFHIFREGFCEYLKSENIDMAYYQRILGGCIVANAVGLSLFIGSIILI